MATPQKQLEELIAAQEKDLRISAVKTKLSPGERDRQDKAKAANPPKAVKAPKAAKEGKPKATRKPRFVPSMKQLLAARQRFEEAYDVLSAGEDYTLPESNAAAEDCCTALQRMLEGDPLVAGFDRWTLENLGFATVFHEQAPFDHFYLDGWDGVGQGEQPSPKAAPAKVEPLKLAKAA